MFGETFRLEVQCKRYEYFEVVVDDEVNKKIAKPFLVEIFTPISESTEVIRNRIVGDDSKDFTVRESENLLTAPISTVDRNAGRDLAGGVEDVFATWPASVLPKF